MLEKVAEISKEVFVFVVFIESKHQFVEFMLGRGNILFIIDLNDEKVSEVGEYKGLLSV
jgi:hypothetical protein